jgi:phosphohistidine phosphatase SixA
LLERLGSKTLKNKNTAEKWMKQIFVLRHAQKNLLTGGITKKGEEECENLRKVLPDIAITISSPKKRCIETAALLVCHDPMIDDKANIEYDTGTELAQLIRNTIKKLRDGQSALIITHEPCVGPAYDLLQNKVPFQERHIFRSLEGFIVDDKKRVKLFVHEK